MLEIWNRHIDDVVELLRVLQVLDDLLRLRAERLVESESVGGLLVFHLEVVLWKDQPAGTISHELRSKDEREEGGERKDSPNKLMIPSFPAWKRTSRSLTIIRKARTVHSS